MTTITFRTDRDVDRALKDLTADGTPTSDAVRGAIVEAWREHRRAILRAAAEAAMNDPEDVAEARRVRAEMDDYAW